MQKVYVQTKMAGDDCWLFYAEHNWAGSEACSSAPLPDFEFGSDFAEAREALAKHFEETCGKQGKALARKVRGWRSMADAKLTVTGPGGDSVESLGTVRYRFVLATPVFDRLVGERAHTHTPAMRRQIEDAITRIGNADDSVFSDAALCRDVPGTEHWTYTIDVLY